MNYTSNLNLSYRSLIIKFIYIGSIIYKLEVDDFLYRNMTYFEFFKKNVFV